MNLIEIVIKSKDFLVGYGIVAASISLVCAGCNLPRFYNESDKPTNRVERMERIGYAIRFSLYDGVVILFGFMIMLVEVLLLIHLFTSNDMADKIIVGILYLTGLPLTLFCVSGKGIEVLNKAFIDPGVRKVTINWRGITIETGK